MSVCVCACVSAYVFVSEGGGCMHMSMHSRERWAKGLGHSACRHSNVRHVITPFGHALPQMQGLCFWCGRSAPQPPRNAASACR